MNEPIRELTPRQRDVAQLVAAGLTNDEIAEKLGMSENTARIHVSAALGRLGLRNRVELALWWYGIGARTSEDDRFNPERAIRKMVGLMCDEMGGVGAKMRTTVNIDTSELQTLVEFTSRAVMSVKLRLSQEGGEG